MVKLREDLPRTPDGRIDVESWVDSLLVRNDAVPREQLLTACELVQSATRRGDLLLDYGLECAELIADLKLDAESILAGLVFRALHGRHIAGRDVRRQLGSNVESMVEALAKLADVRDLELSSSPFLETNAEDQLENVRKMLVSLIDDVRVAIIKLVERIVTLRRLRLRHGGRGSRVGQESLEVFVPLANRLGIWRLKWELEDLAFRSVNPAEYKRIASRLDGRRVEREQQVGQIAESIRQMLAEEGIRSEVLGRAKNIYSIWNKMRTKGVDLNRVYDMRAVRILVETVRECYTTLGLIHTQWHHIPHEFDDYIANPKENGYRSIHTAVIGPDGKTLEVQIRTWEMHEEAELGGCAHWAYKDGTLQPDEQSFYTEKLNWLRQVLEWHEEIGGFSTVGRELRANIEQDRIFVFTPAGHVLDMTAGATPIDMAYRIHTEIGHACAGARVDGRWVPLNYPLSTGQRVEIVTRETPQPERDWLDPELGYVRTARAKAKIKAWFKVLPYEQNLYEGRQRLLREFERLSVHPDLDAVAAQLSYGSVDELCYAVGVMDQPLLDLVEKLSGSDAPAQQSVFGPGQILEPSHTMVEGAGGRPLLFALCCRPMPDAPIIGFPTSGDALLVHRTDCELLLRDQVHGTGHLVELSWQSDVQSEEYAVRIEAHDRPGLVLAVTGAVSDMGKSMTFMRAGSDPSGNAATIELGLRAHDMAEFARILERIRQVPGIVSLRRVAPAKHQ